MTSLTSSSAHTHRTADDITYITDSDSDDLEDKSQALWEHLKNHEGLDVEEFDGTSFEVEHNPAVASIDDDESRPFDGVDLSLPALVDILSDIPVAGALTAMPTLPPKAVSLPVKKTFDFSSVDFTI